LTRYVKRLRNLSLAGLIALSVLAVPAAPAVAKLKCPPGTTNPRYCKHVITVTVKIIITGHRIKIIITVNDPHVTITLRHKGKVLRTLYNKNVTGTFTVPKFTAPKKPGTYVLRIVVRAPGAATKTVNKTIVVTKHRVQLKHKHK